MRFTPAIAAIVLAFTSSLGSAAPSSRIQPRQANADATSSVSLSKTQQLMLSELAADRFNILNKDDDFKFTFKLPDTPEGRGGVLVPANRKTFPALVGSNAGMAVGRIDACGINTFHVHPRSSELQIVISGKIVTEMVPENGVFVPGGSADKQKIRAIRNELNPLDMTVFYQGSVHHQFNPECKPAYFVASFANEDFGAGQVENEVFAMDQDVIAAVLGVQDDQDEADLIKKIIERGVPQSLVQGVRSCLQQCAGQQGQGNGDNANSITENASAETPTNTENPAATETQGQVEESEKANSGGDNDSES